jgi:hypothetical protein
MTVKVEVKRSRNGQGIFATRDFRKGEAIGEVRGKIYDRSDPPPGYNARVSRLLQISADRYLLPTTKLGYYINHSCDPNARVKIGKKVYVVALKSIGQGQEITFDYSTTMNEDDWEMVCRCGSKNCRRRIRDFKYLPKRLQQKYTKLGVVPAFARYVASTKRRTK